MGNLWVTKGPVVAVSTVGHEVDLDAGVVLEEGGLEPQDFEPGRTLFNWVGADSVAIETVLVERHQCEWFVGCNRQSSKYRYHPVIRDGAGGYVPVCEVHAL